MGLQADDFTSLIALLEFKMVELCGTIMAQSVEASTLGFGSWL